MTVLEVSVKEGETLRRVQNERVRVAGYGVAAPTTILAVSIRAFYAF